MNTPINICALLKKNLPVLAGISLCLYFSYHTAFGERSYQRLSDLSLTTKQQTLQLQALKTKTSQLEQKVSMMRIESLSADMVEEQARYILGYNYDDEIILMNN